MIGGLVFGYVMRRILGAFLTVFVVATLAFTLMSIIPGDAAFYVLGEEATGGDIARFRERHGLDRPAIVRLVHWYGSLLRGDLGESITQTGEPVASLIVGRLEPTFLLAAMASTIGIVFGLTLGVVAALQRGKPLDFLSMVFALLGVSIPGFWLGLNLILVFSLHLQWLPTAGYVPLQEDVVQSLRHLLLPAVALGLSQVGVIARMTRANMLQVLAEDYMVTARSKGLREFRVIAVHGFRNALVPTLGVIGVSVVLVLGGAIITEVVFVLPGLGTLTVNAIMRRDFTLMQGILMFVALMTTVVNLAVDLLYGVVDPRIRYS